MGEERGNKFCALSAAILIGSPLMKALWVFHKWVGSDTEPVLVWKKFAIWGLICSWLGIQNMREALSLQGGGDYMCE